MGYISLKFQTLQTGAPTERHSMHVETLHATSLHGGTL